MPQLPFDCIDEIFEYLKDDKTTLRSTLLVNRIWSENSVRFLWRNVSDYNIFHIRTLVACLPNKSKEILYNNGIITSSSTSKHSSMFNYASFCKVLSVNQVNGKVYQLLDENRQSTTSQNLDIVIREIFKLLMNQISSLKEIEYITPLNIPNFTTFLGAKSCIWWFRYSFGIFLSVISNMS